ncbi:MAG: DUF975 family protein [Clostridia bacterium]|nr:DUF975 family protein [Clostridia bacterium]
MEKTKINRVELKEKAKQQLGQNIFGSVWMFALLALLIYDLIIGFASGLYGVALLIVGGPMTYGVSYLFLKQAREGGKMNIGDLFKGFTSDFGGNFLLFLMQTIFICLWSLLFVIPGIVKTYSYSMAFYIKNDHPDYDWKKCIDESKKLMNGHKWELFVLDLSFIGWYCVGSLVFGVGTLWVTPYHQMARTNFYEALVAAPAVETTEA